MNPLDIPMGAILCFYNDGSFIGGRIVEYQERSGFLPPASDIIHIAVSAGGVYAVGATFPRSKTVNILETYQGRRYDVLVWKGLDYLEKYGPRVAFWAATQSNLPFGILGLIGFYVRTILPFVGTNPLDSKRTPFCSQLAGFALRREGIDPWPGVLNGDLTPAHFRANGGFKVYNGGVAYVEGQVGKDKKLNLEFAYSLRDELNGIDPNPVESNPCIGLG